ncbi:MAG TPA: hypothetical protein VGH72_13770 [Pseudonocardia sp.]
MTGAKHSGTAVAEFLRLTSASAGDPQALGAALLADASQQAIRDDRGSALVWD